ncbi:TonB-dependent receptor plug domain-containing protein [Flavobacterium foetidum]|uniref:TonB-dependent receptor plug domain-containing protein n=1 Tax=Flavobacterium foetidum TaxID=2026681 RepID=UPI001074B469|nr:TonB-dependent receptor plug domain-containing protein [Flavobacterium foetidum]KAF2517654.1 TonB-dependent receptor plug domain-containing protein [Flavobacterium foetidum]
MMKKIYFLFLLAFQVLFSQNAESDWNAVYKKSITEKVYLQLNNVLYVPGDIVYFRAFVTESDNSPSSLSEYVYVDIVDSSDKKIASQMYAIENGAVSGSYFIPEDKASGLYKIIAYTKMQANLSDAVFQKTFFVQKVVAPRILMTLDFKKKAYGSGEICEADFELKNLESQPIKNYNFKYDVFLEGKKIDSAVGGKTDDLGKAVIRFKLPEDLKSNDGILNVMLDYDNFKESVTRSIPINLNFIDLQFLPESGYLVENETSSLFYIAKNEFGLPMDVAGFIEDEDGNRIADFKSDHDGMGNAFLKTAPDKKYFAVVTSPFLSKEKIALPEAQKNVFAINAKKQTESVSLNVYAPFATDAKVLVRNTAKIHKTNKVSLKQGWNSVEIKTKDLPVGIQSFSLLVADKIVAERLVFLNYQDGLKIEIKTDKQNYLPREKVQVSIFTKDKNNNPIASSLSVSVVDAKLITYIDDKQDNILSWLLLGAELKGTIHEPRYYFDENKKQEDREKAIDLLLNTHGWRKYNQDNLQNLFGLAQKIRPEKINSIQGFVLNHKGKPVSVKVLLFTDQEKVYETKSNSSGYFEFRKVNFLSLAMLAAEGKNNRNYSIKNSITNQEEFAVMRDTLSNFSSPNIEYPYIEQKESKKEKGNIKGNSVSLDSDNNSLQDVLVVAGYGSVKRSSLTGAIVRVSGQEISNSLSGRAAGIQISPSSGQVAGTDKIVIRGLSSIYGSRSGGQPLVVIDGIPYADNENASVFGSLPTDMIQSITILKDANATSIYGSAAVNGVIVVTTKNNYYLRKILLGKNYRYVFQYINKTNGRKLNEADDFYVPNYKTVIAEEKTDFRSCLYWNAVIQTNNNGKATFEFYNSDENTSFKILAEGTSYKGDLGKAEAVYVVKDIIQTDVKVPVYVSQEDIVMIPLWLKNNSDENVKLENSALFNDEKIDFQNSIELKENESRTVFIPLSTDKIGKNQPLEITISGENYRAKIKKVIDVYPKGFPKNIDISGSKSQTVDFLVTDPLVTSIEGSFKLFYNPFSFIFDGLESMIREPYGCFEQVSSSNYPNIMVMQLSKLKNVSPEFKAKAMKFLENGYKKLKNYESRGGGFEWYGGNPGNEALTAYGLMQFYEMKEFVNVDQEMINRTLEWMNSRKDEKGGFKMNHAKYGFSGVKYEVNNAYIVYVLSEIGGIDLEKQYQAALREALKSNDLYRLTLTALASFNLKKIDQYKKLMALIKVEVSKKGIIDLEAEQSVVYSRGKSMNIEIAALYGLAILKEKEITKEFSEILDYLQTNKSSYGFGSTQATALTLKLIAEFTKINVNTKVDEKATLYLNNELIDLTQKDLNGNVMLKNLKVSPGKNNFSFQSASESVPYLFAVQYQTFTPDNSKKCSLILKTKTRSDKIKMSETARVEIEVENTENNEVSNPIVRIGIPGGLTPEPWQLKELVEKNAADYYEIFGNELVLYFRKLNANEKRKINIDFKAIVPGKYKGIASSAYLYYERERKNWDSGIEVEVIP